MPEPDCTLVLVRDLFFSTKIMQTAKSLDCPVKLIRDPAKLAGQAGRQLIVDLNLPGAIEAAAAWQSATAGRAIGFVSHVDADTIARARAQGIAQVLARSSFTEMLPAISWENRKLNSDFRRI